MAYCYDNLAKARALELEREARLERLVAEARRASAAGRVPWRARLASALRQLGGRPTSTAKAAPSPVGPN
jgi:hypothetical protein